VKKNKQKKKEDKRERDQIRVSEKAGTKRGASCRRRRIKRGGKEKGGRTNEEKLW